jgi:hypothetical protein
MAYVMGYMRSPLTGLPNGPCSSETFLAKFCYMTLANRDGPLTTFEMAFQQYCAGLSPAGKRTRENRR